MNSRQYEKMMKEALATRLSEEGINKDDYISTILSADRTEYTILMKDGTTKIIASGFEYFED